MTTRPPRVVSLVCGGALMVLAPLLVAVGAGSASAAPLAVNADVCATPTTTISGGGSGSVSIKAGEVVLLAAGTYTGRINDLVNGGTLCVAGDAALIPNNFTTPGGDLVVLGRADLPPFDSSAGFDLFVSGTAVIQKANLRNGGAVSVAESGTLTGGPLRMPASHHGDTTGRVTARGLVCVSGYPAGCRPA